ncbi:MltG/YceG/YrrL family protein [Anaerovorax odorimutans]|uniref:hypothetical protein n=1 Tax=Anaerovorax odorimutans TaxID=109327 RepID=UPI0003F6BBB9|nr:hypothetical protein [Anaerovorax odorimutans]
MQTFRNIIYDKNDILIALVIICIAGLIIFNRINVIMSYPSSLTIEKAGNESKHTTSDNKSDNKAATTTDESIDNSKGNEKTSSESDNTKKSDDIVKYSVYIEPGSTDSKIADTLLSVNLIKDKQEFYDAIAAAGADSKLKAGTFIIPSNSTPADIVAIITK